MTGFLIITTENALVEEKMVDAPGHISNENYLKYMFLV
jgi:hypothetical protein